MAYPQKRSFEKKDNSGAIFKNKEMRPGRKDPEYRGQVVVNGREYWVASWINKAKDSGENYMSLKLTPKTDSAKEYKKEDYINDEPLNDDIPF